MKQGVLWGTRKGNEEWQEELLASQREEETSVQWQARVKAVKQVAKKDGFDKFREGSITLGQDPSKLFKSGNVIKKTHEHVEHSEHVRELIESTELSVNDVCLKLLESSAPIFWHGSTDKNLKGTRGIHVGTFKAATEALEARIGIPAEGSWDGTREYGKTLLAGQKSFDTDPRLRYRQTGFNCRCPEEDYYPTDRDERATYSDNSIVPFNCKPIVFQVRIIGQMSNTLSSPMDDARANGTILRFLKSGKAKSGYYYINIAEDAGSTSAVVPDASFLAVI